MRAYHFIKYTDTTFLEPLITRSDNNTILCFDFEDSIQDCINPANSSILKVKHRTYFKNIIDKCALDNSSLKIGLRLNPTDSPEYLLDLIAIADIQSITSIFLPKITNSEQILKLQNDLQSNGISYDEIVPVIETKTGLNNLEAILKNNSSTIRRVAFGHCDYNFDSHNYPYFHQDSKEYWTWIMKIFEALKSYHLNLINSPMLSLSNNEAFITMLRILYSICGRNCDQITLTKQQTELCHAFSKNKLKNILPKIRNRLDLRVPDFYAENFIRSFEENQLNKGFAINNKRTLLSPQEYFSSLNYRKQANFPDVNFTFVGGCFPVQGNIPFENIFHKILKHKIESIREVKFNVNIIRYEHFKNGLNKIASYKANNPIDILVLSIRPEPFLRLVKLYYEFLDNKNGRKIRSLNLPKLKGANLEKHDLLSLNPRFNPTVGIDNSTIHKALINLNYILGSLVGNDNYALRKYLDFINEVIVFNRKNNIKLFILGTPIRTNTIIEKFLSKKLDNFIRKSLILIQDDFICGTEPSDNRDNLFQKNGIFATEKYHELIAKKLIKKILPAIDKITAPDN